MNNLAKNCTCGISTGFRGYLRESAQLERAGATYSIMRAGWTYSTTTRRASTKRAATNMGDAGLPEEALQICLSANKDVDNLVDERQLCNLQGVPHCLVHRHSRCATSGPLIPHQGRNAGSCTGWSICG